MSERPPQEYPHIITLPKRLDTAAYEDLKTLLLERAAVNVSQVMDGSKVTYLGGLCLELLLASGFKIASYSDELAKSLQIFGVFETLTHDGIDHV